MFRGKNLEKKCKPTKAIMLENQMTALGDPALYKQAMSMNTYYEILCIWWEDSLLPTTEQAQTSPIEHESK
jgi:hypothetical protein